MFNDDAELQENLGYFALYISCFPQLIAGPIVHYKDIATQLSDRKVGSYEFAEGIKRFCFGLSKKVLIANTLAAVADKVWATNLSNLDATTAWLGAICYTFQIYYDFSGYSDMAIGLGKMFRDYVYIPMGGSRCSISHTCLNIFVVFLLTGIWHGANWTFLVWGVVYGILLIIERLWFGKILEKNPVKFVNRLLIFIIVTLLWVVFRAENIMDAGVFISRMFIGGFKPLNLINYLSGLSVIALVCAPVMAGFLQDHMSVKAVKGNAFVCLALLMLSMLFLVNGTYNPFIYYQF